MRFYNITYFLREGFASIFAHRIMSFASMSVITACLVLMGSFSLVAINIDRLLDDVEDKNEVVAYVDETYTEDRARGLEGEIKKIPEIDTISFMTKSTAFQNFKEDFGEEGEILEGLEDRNPLRDRFTVTVKNIRDTKAVADKLGKIDGIAKVSSRSDISDKILQVRDVVTLICFALILILILVSVFIISNTVNITMFNRREEIAIMKMIGASNGFIRIPFVIEGLLLGISGALIALALQWGVYEYVVARALSTVSFIPTVSFKETLWYIAAMFFGLGILVGGVGSAITLRKFLKV